MKPLLRLVDHDFFKETLLPAIQKAILRNPEIALESVGNALQGLNIDLSQYVAEVSLNSCLMPSCLVDYQCYSFQVSRLITSNLHAKDDDTRAASVEATASLASQCSDPEAVLVLVRALFAVLGGSEGKLSVNSHKCSLLAALGKVASSCAVSVVSLQPVSVAVFQSSIKVRLCSTIM